MATITFPPNALITDVTLEVRTPNQVRHESIYDGSVQVLTRGPSRFGGVFTLGITDSATEAHVSEIEAFLTELQGWTNDFRLPIHRPRASTIATGTTVRVTASAFSNGAARFTFNTGSIPRGDYITVANRLYQSLGSSRFSPAVLVPNGSLVEYENPYVLARLGGDEPTPVESFHGAQFSGPWVIEFEEVI